jgi:spore coat protein U-like protein
MNKIRLITVAGLAALLSVTSHATPSPQQPQFDVNITLTPTCQATSVSTIQITYVGFDTGITSSGGDFSLTCTNGMAYTFALDGTEGTATARNYTDQATSFEYTLTTPAASNTGTGALQTKQIAASKTAASAFNFTCANNSTTGCNNSTSTNKTRTLTISY